MVFDRPQDVLNNMEASPVFIHRHGLLAAPAKSTTHTPWTINNIGGNGFKGCMIMLSLRAFIKMLDEAIEIISLVTMNVGINLAVNMFVIMSGIYDATSPFSMMDMIESLALVR